jgi:hypothetical protein
MITVEFKSAGSKRFDVVPFNFDPDADDHSGNEPFRVRDLITKLVNESVRDFQLREKDRVVGFLTPAKIDQGVITGKFGSPRDEVQKVDLDEAVGQALQAFEDGLYLLFVDESEKRELDELVVMHLDTKVTLIRLTALAGW